jgi:hypothetical protein
MDDATCFTVPVIERRLSELSVAASHAVNILSEVVPVFDAEGDVDSWREQPKPSKDPALVDAAESFLREYFAAATRIVREVGK